MPEGDPIPLWQHVHGACTHFSVAMTLAALFFDLGAILPRRSDWRSVGFWMILCAAILSLPSVGSGLAGQLGWFGAEKWEAARMLSHRNFALGGSVFVLVAALIRAGCRDRLTGTGRGAILALEAIAAGLIGWAGYLGAYVARGY